MKPINGLKDLSFDVELENLAPEVKVCLVPLNARLGSGDGNTDLVVGCDLSHDARVLRHGIGMERAGAVAHRASSVRNGACEVAKIVPEVGTNSFRVA